MSLIVKNKTCESNAILDLIVIIFLYGWVEYVLEGMIIVYKFRVHKKSFYYSQLIGKHFSLK